MSVPRSVLVTGGAGALGFAMAARLCEGRKVVLIDLGSAVADRAADLPDALGLSCDLADPAALRDGYAEAARFAGPFGIVIHAAGIASVTPFLDTERAVFERTVAINLVAAFDLFQLAARDLVAARAPGRMVAISSISGSRAGFGRTAYGVSKAGLTHLVAQMALELGPYGITANAVSPGPVDTPLSRANHTAEQRADYQRTIPAGRYGTAAEVADTVAFLVSDEAGYVSGQTLFVDGGYMASGMGVTIAQSQAAIRRGS
ncbi:MAG: SDR family NAD(P)-dependent oxidoreductase [Pseudomonadota bacterium]